MKLVYEINCHADHAAAMHAQELRNSGDYRRVVKCGNIVRAYQ